MMLVKYMDVGRAKQTWETRHHMLTPKTLWNEIKKSGALMSDQMRFIIEAENSNRGLILVHPARIVGSLTWAIDPEAKIMAKHWDVIKDGSGNFLRYEGSYCPPELRVALSGMVLS